MSAQHHYQTTVTWTGNSGSGTSGYRDYQRNHTIHAEHKQEIAGSSDPAFRGDPGRYNPEELLLASLSSCHMLWYLHLCAEGGVIVTAYSDQARGVMTETANGSGQFTEVILNPTVRVLDSFMAARARELHKKANEMCFIARSVNFPVGHEATVISD